MPPNACNGTKKSRRCRGVDVYRTHETRAASSWRYFFAVSLLFPTASLLVSDTAFRFFFASTFTIVAVTHLRLEQKASNYERRRITLTSWLTATLPPPPSPLAVVCDSVRFEAKMRVIGRCRRHWRRRREKPTSCCEQVEAVKRKTWWMSKFTRPIFSLFRFNLVKKYCWWFDFYAQPLTYVNNPPIVNGRWDRESASVD